MAGRVDAGGQTARAFGAAEATETWADAAQSAAQSSAQAFAEVSASSQAADTAQPLVPSASPTTACRSISILGATGSIGTSTLDLVAANRDRYRVVAVTANDNVDALADIARRFDAQFAGIANPDRYDDLKRALSGTGVRVGAGEGALVEAAQMDADCVMAAIMGAAGLKSSLAALERGARLALANKECLVSAGPVFMAAAARSAGVLLPVDSEHSAIFQSLAGQCRDRVERVTVTASGGPFRTWSRSEMVDVRPEDALKHPNWSMGRKITIDSATMMNKGLELIEAHFLFDLAPDQLEVVVHPQSIVHSLVSYVDGSVIAQLGAPDMRTPIAYALAWPDRIYADIPRLDLAALATLTFEAPDPQRFPALRLAHEVMQAAGTAPAILNAANEVAVAAFLDRRLSFTGISEVVERTLDVAAGNGLIRPVDALEHVLSVDAAARELARDVIRASA